MDSKQIKGTWDSCFSPVVEKLQSQIDSGQHAGGAVAICKDGDLVLDVYFGSRNRNGDPWEQDTMAVAFSTTKGMASLALHLLADAGEIDYDTPVARYWPEFAKCGKERITVRHVLTHESGLHNLGDYVTDPSAILDWERIVSIIESMEPAYPPGTANGYHALSFGWLVGEIVRRVSGTDIQTFVRQEIAEPLELDGFYIGMPASEAVRVAMLEIETDSFPQIPLVGPPSEVSAHREVGGASSNTRASAPSDLPMQRAILEAGTKAIVPGTERIIANDIEILTVPIPAANGVFTARSLAKAYSAMIDGTRGGGRPILSAKTLEKISTVYNTRADLVIGIPMMWRLGYHSVFTGAGVIPKAIGHFGFGGSGAFLDLETHVSAALVLNKISLSFLGNLRFVELAGVALECVQK